MQLIIGKKAILDAIDNKTLVSATISDKDKKFFNKVINFIKDVKVCNDKSFFEKIAKDAHHQFAIGYVNATKVEDLASFFQDVSSQKNSIVLILDNIEDPQNFGAIIRTAESIGVDAIVYKKDNQCQITPTVIKASAGAIANLKMLKVTNLVDTINKLKENGYWVYASCLDKTSHKLNDIKFNGKVAIVVGNENKGISPLVLKNSDFKVYIETAGKTQSLNVSAATAILLYKIKSCLENK